MAANAAGGTSLALLLGAMAPQLISFGNYSDHFYAACILVQQATIVLALCLLPLPAIRLLRRSQKICCLAFVTGAAMFLWHAANTVAGRLDPNFNGDSMLITLRIVDFPGAGGGGVSFAAEPVDDVRIPARIRLSWFEAPVSVRIGDLWRVVVRLKAPRGARNPGTMDYEAWLFRERIGATGYVVNSRHNLLLDSDTVRGIDRYRQHLVQRIQRLLPDPELAAVVVALAVGTRHLMSPEQWERYARTGTSHLMAISGLHVGLAAIASYAAAALLLGITGGQGNSHDRALLVALAVAALYAVLSGLAVPARRAILMLALLTAVLLARRQSRGLRLLLLVAAVVVLLDPLATLSPGFILSFGAVALLLWIALRTSPKGPGRCLRLVHGARGLCAIQFALLLGLLPVTVALFDRISLAAPLINLLAVPLFSVFTVPLALLGVLCDGPLAGVGDTLLRLCASSIGLIEHLIRIVAADDDSAQVIAGLHGAMRGCVLLTLCWVLLPAQWPGRYVAWPALFAVLAYAPKGPPHDCVDLTLLDVGQGQSVVVRTRHRVLLYDAGPLYRSGASAGERVVVPYLQNQGIARVDVALISHSDLDHSGGLPAILAAVPVGPVLSGDPLALVGVPASRCAAGTRWTWDGIHFTVLHPAPAAALTRNAASCVLLIEAGERRALLSGDIEAATETRLVQARVLPTVDLASVPHHGSLTSSIMPFVLSLAPDYAVVSAAWSNQWGLPKPQVVARWRRAEATVLNTATSGAVSARLCRHASQISVKEYRKSVHRPWHADN